MDQVNLALFTTPHSIQMIIQIQRKTKKSFVEEVSSMKTNKPNKKVRDIRHNLGF